MKTKMRRYQKDEDYELIRGFLRKVLLINDRQQLSWDVARFDYWRWHGVLNMKDGTLETDVFLWETDAGELAAVLNREAPGSVFLQIHPSINSRELELEMLSVAEKHLTVEAKDGRRSLHVWVESGDSRFRETVESCGYERCTGRKSEHQRRRIIAEPIAPVAPADGYLIRPLGGNDEHSARCWVSFRAFHPNDPEENFEDGWYHNVQKAPLYRRDLDLVAEAPNGEIAAFCTIWFDDCTETGLFEPVGTAPEYQRLRLGKAILTEGLIRLRNLGAALAYVQSYTESAHGLYESVGFRTYRILEPWSKSV